MRHLETGVVSLGHFDNFCCWAKFGEKSSAHKEGISTMLNEISKLDLSSERENVFLDWEMCLTNFDKLKLDLP